jgi:hypothetical protein
MIRATEVAAVTNRLLTKIAASQVAVVRTKHASITASIIPARLGVAGPIAASALRGMRAAMADAKLSMKARDATNMHLASTEA